MEGILSQIFCIGNYKCLYMKDLREKPFLFARFGFSWVIFWIKKR